jgi:hypothetical protein
MLGRFTQEVVIPQRSRLLAYREITNQSAQVDSDGYLAQIISSIVTGVPGNARRGKSGGHSGDLSDGTEVKSTYRAEQMHGKEDGHINFGQITREKMAKFLDRDRCIAVFASYDVHGRFKIEILDLRLRESHVRQAVRAFLQRSPATRPQLQPRLYPDGRRDVLQEQPGSFKHLGARLLARVVDVAGSAVVDKWAPEAGLGVDQVLDVCPGPLAGAPPLGRVGAAPDRFFADCMVRHRRALVPFCQATWANQNVGFGNLAQHLVSLVTRKRGIGSGARGADLEDGSEIKLAMGMRGDALGTEDVPRLNLGGDATKMLGWTRLYPVRIVCEADRLKVKVLEADTGQFRRQVRDYFGPASRYRRSPNMQYHVPRDFEVDEFTGESGDGSERRLRCQRLYVAYE